MSNSLHLTPNENEGQSATGQGFQEQFKGVPNNLFVNFREEDNGPLDQEMTDA